MEEKDSKLKNLNKIKTILMLCVVFAHSIDYWKGNWFTVIPLASESRFLYYFADFFNSFHIYAFTLISGYLFYYLKVEQSKYKYFWAFIKNKALRLLVPYVFVSVCWVIPIQNYFYKYSFSEIIRRYLLGLNSSQLWFLLMLFWVYIISWLLCDFLNKKPVILSFIIAFLFYLLGVIGNKVIPNYYYFWSSCEYLIYFIIGMILRRTEWIDDNYEYLYIICYITLLLLWETIDSRLINRMLELALHIFGAVSAFITINNIVKMIETKNDRIISLLSMYSMPMYLFHQQLIYFSILLFNGKVIPLINGILNFVFAIIGSYLISFVMMKWSLTRFLIGEK